MSHWNRLYELSLGFKLGFENTETFKDLNLVMLTSCKILHLRDVPALVCKFPPNLSYLDIDAEDTRVCECIHLDHLSWLHINANEPFDRINWILPALTTLQLRFVEGDYYGKVDFTTPLTKWSPRLKYISLGCVRVAVPYHLVRDLTVWGEGDFDDEFFEYINVQELHVHNVRTEEYFHDIWPKMQAEGFIALEHIYFYHCGKVDTKKLIDVFPNLKHLGFKNTLFVFETSWLPTVTLSIDWINT